MSRRRLYEANDDEVILNSIYDLTHVYGEDGDEYPFYFNAQEICDNYGLTMQQVVDIAKANNYNVYRVPVGEDLINIVVIAHENLSYGDVVKDIQSQVDINALGDETDDSFNMEEDYMDEVIPFTQRQVFDELKRETDNFTKEDTFRYSFESEWNMAIKILLKHYEDVDWWSDWDKFGIDHTMYFVDFKTPKKGKKKVQEEKNIENDAHSYLDRLKSAKTKQELDTIKKEIMKDDSLSVEDSDKLFKVCHELLADLKEDIEKHEELNPKLFEGDELKPEIKDKIEQIAYQFIRELNEDGIHFTLKDIVLLGSNVSYNYTKDSDLDVHLIADSSGFECPKELYDKLYGAYRSIFNKNYDIRIKGIPTEIYVEMDDCNAKSNGVYSINNGWIKHPEQTAIPDLDKEAFDKLFKEWEDRYNKLVGDKEVPEETTFVDTEEE